MAHERAYRADANAATQVEDEDANNLELHDHQASSPPIQERQREEAVAGLSDGVAEVIPNHSSSFCTNPFLSTSSTSEEKSTTGETSSAPAGFTPSDSDDDSEVDMSVILCTGNGERS